MQKRKSIFKKSKAGYSQIDLESAIIEMLNGTSLNQVSKKYGISKSVLSRKRTQIILTNHSESINSQSLKGVPIDVQLEYENVIDKSIKTPKQDNKDDANQKAFQKKVQRANISSNNNKQNKKKSQKPKIYNKKITNAVPKIAEQQKPSTKDIKNNALNFFITRLDELIRLTSDPIIFAKYGDLLIKASKLIDDNKANIEQVNKIIIRTNLDEIKDSF